jgi:hypothetical protein
MICKICEDVLGHLIHNYLEGHEKPGPTASLRYPHHPTFQSLQRSVDAKCWLCSTLWTSLTSKGQSAICEAYGAPRCSLIKKTPALTSISMTDKLSGDFDFGMSLNCGSSDPTRNFRQGKLFKVRKGKLGLSRSLFK